MRYPTQYTHGYGYDTRMLRVNPIHQITPFTYRDGSTYLEVLNGLREYVTQVAVPEVHRELNRIISEFQSALSEVERTRDADLAEWKEQFNQFMADVTESLAGLNDAAVAQNILDSDTETWEALSDRFPSHTMVNALVDNVRSDLNDAVDTINSTVSDLESSLTSDINNVQSNLDDAVDTINSTVSDLESSLNSEVSDLNNRITTVRDDLRSELNSRTANMVRGTGVGHVIATKNVETTLNNGDLLVALETEQYFTDFTENLVSEEDENGNVGGPIRGWTPQWDSVAEDFSILEDSGATGNRALLFNHFDDDLRAISWDVASSAALDHEVIEVVFKWRPGLSGISSMRAVTHGSGSDGLEWGFFGGTSSKDRHISGSWNGDREPYFYSPSELSPTPQYPEWWITRFRVVEDDTTYLKNWKHGRAEPETWVEVSINNTPPRGWVGLINVNGQDGAGIVDWIGVAFEGGRAPMGG